MLVKNQSPIVQEKSKDTCFKKYGTKYANQSQEVQDKIKKTNLERYGNEYAIASNIVRDKIVDSFYKNGTIPTSKPQLKLRDILLKEYGNCELNYPVNRVFLDCMVKINDIKIDCEYDGQYWHKDKEIQDRNRNYFLMTKGYKILRIEGNYKIPSIEELKEAIASLVEGEKKLIKIKCDI